MKQVLATFFGGNLESAVATLLSEAETQLSDEEAARLSSLIEEAAREPESHRPPQPERKGNRRCTHWMSASCPSCHS
jgi:hypothetical protein